MSRRGNGRLVAIMNMLPTVVEGYLSPRGEDAALALNMIKLLQDPNHARTPWRCRPPASH